MGLLIIFIILVKDHKIFIKSILFMHNMRFNGDIGEDKKLINTEILGNNLNGLRLAPKTTP